MAGLSVCQEKVFVSMGNRKFKDSTGSLRTGTAVKKQPPIY